MIRMHLNNEEIKYILNNHNKLSSKEMAEWIGCVPGTVVYQLKKHGLKPINFSKWSPKRIEKLIQLRREGLSRKSLAIYFNVTEYSIQGQLKILRKNGIYVPTHLDIKRRNNSVLRKSV